ncbi:MAG TPA: BA14K family protein, partial [Pseudolabrys sp.]|nr:BA14K family protein [Pseudolabrys sp.]
QGGGGYAGGGYAQPGYGGDDGVAYCAQRFRTYDQRSGTYVGKGGRRIPCP